MKPRYILKNKSLDAALKLYDYMGYYDYSEEDYLDTIENDWENDYLTDHVGKDGKYYLWYVNDEAHDSVAIRVADGEILTDEKEIFDIVGIPYPYDDEEQSDEEGC